jgi:hypothetical protein
MECYQVCENEAKETAYIHVSSPECRMESQCKDGQYMSFKIVPEFRYLGMSVTNKSRLNLGNAWYHLLQNLLFVFPF